MVIGGRDTNFTMPHDCRFNVESWIAEMVEGSREYDVSDILMLPPPTVFHSKNRQRICFLPFLPSLLFPDLKMGRCKDTEI